jgi:hypothetical protein
LRPLLSGKIVDRNDKAENRLNARGGRITSDRDRYFRAAYQAGLHLLYLSQLVLTASISISVSPLHRAIHE